MSLPAGWKWARRRVPRLRLVRSRYGALLLIVNLLLAFPLLVAPAAAAPLRILALGDSLTAGYGLPDDQSFPVQLEKALKARGHDVKVINAGVSGDTTAGGLARLDWALADKPDFAIVELGANDGLRGLEPEQTHANLDAIVARLQQAGVPVLLAGMVAPPNLGREYQEQFAAAYVRVLQKHPVTFYPFFLDGVAAQAGLNQQDGLHPTAQGVRVIVEHILPSVERMLASRG
jgi:acyl-CoA thioesterase-1